MAETTKLDGDNKGGCIVAAVIIGVIVMIAQCSGDHAGSSNSETLSKSSPFPTTVADPPPIRSFSKAFAVVGVRHLSLVLSAGEAAGAQLYSENCYSGLAQSFSWNDLDRCGAFDEAAVLIADRGNDLFQAGETSYFESEAAAGRYLKAAIAGGLTAEAADERFEQLRKTASSVARAHGLKKTLTSSPKDEKSDDPANGSIDGIESIPANEETASDEVLAG